ncbi:MAG TPA: hypothetical protein VJ879_09590 [Desulfobacter sp.]|nr:hypothetical protein [Desulfobacter sp.]
MTTWFDNLKNEIETFFDKATDEEIEKALDKANYSFYKNVYTPILEMNQQDGFDFIYTQIISVDLKNQSSGNTSWNKEFNCNQFCRADESSFEYSTAA